MELKANTEGKAKGELPNLGNYTVKCIAEDFKDSEQQRGSLDPISANNTEENRQKIGELSLWFCNI